MVSVSLGEAFVSIQADMKMLDKGLQAAGKKISKSLRKMADEAKKVGNALTKNLTLPIVALGTIAVRNFDKQIRAERQLAAVIKATGGDAEAQLDAFKAYASALQAVTVVGDEATLANIQMAKSMGLTSEQAARAAKNAIAMSAAFGINEQSAIRVTAALEQGETSMLTRYIPTIRTVEDETEKVALAQKILADNFAIAEEAARVGLGPMRQLSNSVGDLTEKLGDVILQGLNPMVRQLRDFVDSIQSVDRNVLIAITGIAGAVAILGPAIRFLAFSFTGLALILKVFLSRLLLIPTAVIAGVAAMDALATSAVNSYTFWEKFNHLIKDAASDISDLAKTGMGALIDAFINVTEEAKALDGGLDAVNAAMEQLQTVTGTTAPALNQQADAFDDIAQGAADAQFELDLLSGKYGDVNKEALRAAYAAGILDEAVQQTGQGANAVQVLDLRFAELVDTLDDVKEKQEEVAEEEQKVTEMGQDLGIVMESAFEKAVVAGEDLRDVLRGLLDDLIKIALRKAIIEPIAGALFGTGGEAGLLSGFLPTFASGGSIPGGQLSVVGEKGPELFVPGSSGTIIPNNRLGGMNFGAPVMIQQVQVIAPPGSEVTEERENSGDIETIRIFISEAVSSEISKTGSPINRSLTSTFGLNRQLTAR